MHDRARRGESAIERERERERFQFSRAIYICVLNRVQ